MQPILLIVLLTCHEQVAHEQCTRDTAMDVRIVGKTELPNACMIAGATVDAREGIGGPGRYCVTRCIKT